MSMQFQAFIIMQSASLQMEPITCKGFRSFVFADFAASAFCSMTPCYEVLLSNSLQFKISHVANWQAQPSPPDPPPGTGQEHPLLNKKNH
jgi:hypothetical protein